MKRGWVLPGALLVAVFTNGCKGTEPAGMINIVLDPVPRFTRDASLLVTGNATRTPTSSKTVLVITTAGGAASAVDTINTDRFEMRVTLTSNAANQLSITGTDATGSTSNTVSATVRHDNQAPTLAQVTPGDTTDNAAPSTAVAVRFSEAVVLSPTGGVRVVRQGVTVTGTTTVSADSTTLTFTPAGGLSPNAVYRVLLTGVSDAAGNALGATAGSCFATAPAGAAPIQAFPDSSTPDRFSGQALGPTVPLPPDLVNGRFVRDGTLLAGILRFSGPRTFSYTAANHAVALIDLDLDRDTTTGYLTFKDSLMRSQQDATFRAYQSRIRAEYLIGLEPAVGDTAAYVGRYIGFDSVELIASFVPTACGAMLGFALPFSLLNNDDGLANILITGLSGLTQPWQQFWIDPFPTTGNLPLDLRAPVAAPPAATAAVIEPVSGTLIRRRPLPAVRLRP